MAPLQPSISASASASASPSPQFNSRNLGRGLLQEGAGAGAGAGAEEESSGGKSLRVGTSHLPPERSASFHGRGTNAAASADPHEKQQMRRPKTQPDLIAAAGGWSTNIMMRKVPAKVLVNVNVQRSLGALQVMASTEWKVNQLVAATVKQYVKEGRRPLLPITDPSVFALHYSQFSLECLDPMEKLIGLGSRNFFLCPNTDTAVTASTLPPPGSGSGSGPGLASSSSSCSKEANKASKITIPWLRFMDFLF